MSQTLAEKREYLRKWRRNVRHEVLVAYGAKCKCCGEIRPEFLTLDHVNNDGAAERRALGVHSGLAFYRIAKQEGFPPRFQLLCVNCNLGKSLHGECPHVREL